MQAVPASTGRPRRAEVLAALSVSIDLGLGQPAEHMLRSAVIATRLADRLAPSPSWLRPPDASLACGSVGTRDLDGCETIYGPGDLAHIPPGHDGWTIGDKNVSWVEIPH
jgi:hypothetical protein